MAAPARGHRGTPELRMNVALCTKEGAQRHIHTCLFGARGASGANGLPERATPVGAESMIGPLYWIYGVERAVH